VELYYILAGGPGARSPQVWGKHWPLSRQSIKWAACSSSDALHTARLTHNTHVLTDPRQADLQHTCSPLDSLLSTACIPCISESSSFHDCPQVLHLLAHQHIDAPERGGAVQIPGRHFAHGQLRKRHFVRLWSHLFADLVFMEAFPLMLISASDLSRLGCEARHRSDPTCVWMCRVIVTLILVQLGGFVIPKYDIGGWWYAARELRSVPQSLMP